MKEKKNKKEKPEEEKKSSEIEVERVEKADVTSNDLADEILELNKDLNKYKEDSETLRKENNDLKDQLLRKAAEFENFKRRKENEYSKMLEYAAEPIILKVLEVYSDFERAVTHAGENQNQESLLEGLNLVYNKFTKTLEEQQVKKVGTKGEPFDFNLHEALMQQESADHPHHTVLEEIEAGYTYKEKVIKHAKVIVSQQSVDNSSDKAEKKSIDKKV